ncbi:acylphosphatase [Agarivorans sp. Z349TD_8]|uniref:acylphosphatase n=1 Tax=Agarivorans sp. Z349TD_8 TaxID=3421434 RepID=UPI003D7E3357
MRNYRLLAVVKGHVQGVGYRYHVMQQASKSDIVGYAKNLANGDVEIFAEGKQTNLEQLISFLYHASPLGRVSEVETLEFISIDQKSKTNFVCY